MKLHPRLAIHIYNSTRVSDCPHIIYPFLYNHFFLRRSLSNALDCRKPISKVLFSRFVWTGVGPLILNATYEWDHVENSLQLRFFKFPRFSFRVPNFFFSNSFYWILLTHLSYEDKLFKEKELKCGVPFSIYHSIVFF